jgi:hypothetical protein
MRAAIVTAVVALGVLAAVEVGLRTTDTVPDPVIWGSPYTQARAEALFDLGDIDVVSLGSSIGGASLATDDLTDGIGYNASLPAMAPRIWLPWYRDVVSGVDPDLVVLAVDMRFFDAADPQAEVYLQDYLTSPGRLRHVEGPTLSDRVGDVWELYRLRSRLREVDELMAALSPWGEVDEWRPIRLSDDGRQLGFGPAEYEPDPEWLERLAVGYADAEWGGVEEEAIRTIVDEALADGSDVVLVITPAVWSEFSKAFPNGMTDVEAYRAAIRAIGDDFGVPVLEFPQFDDDTSLYADYYHMNALGSRRLTAALAEALADLGLGR